MQPPYPPRPPYPPPPGPGGESDPALLARLGGPDTGGRHHAVALLLARHWPATRDHAVVCLADAGPTAHLVAAAAFHQVLAGTAGGAADGVNGGAVGGAVGGVSGGALRPRLLVAVRDTVRAWASDAAACAVLPELRKTTGGRGLRATKPGPAESRQLAARAFRSLPGAAQCLLWHTEVEAEPINIPAGLLGVDTITASAALEQARGQFRAGCVRAHRELAPTEECRFHNRLLDIPLRRGGLLLPEVRRHLAVCRHCRYAAEQLGRFDGGLPLLLAESVLGWGARRYLASRPARAAVEDRSAVRDRPTWWRPARVTVPRASGGRHRKAMAVGVGLTSLALLVTALSVRSWSDDNGVPGAGGTWAAPAADTPWPGGAGAHSAASAG
ncbi:hydrolase, partial [Streptomyces nogalater]